LAGAADALRKKMQHTRKQSSGHYPQRIKKASIKLTNLNIRLFWCFSIQSKADAGAYSRGRSRWPLDRQTGSKGPADAAHQN
jgi:hypothetical protein